MREGVLFLLLCLAASIPGIYFGWAATRWLRSLGHKPSGTHPAELAQAAVDYLGQRYPDWKWEAQDEPYFLDSVGTVTGIATIGRRRYAMRLSVPCLLQYQAREDALDGLYAYLDARICAYLRRDGLLAEEVEE